MVVMWSPDSPAAAPASSAVASQPSRSPSHIRAMLAQPRAPDRSVPVSSGEEAARSSSASPSCGRPLAISA